MLGGSASLGSNLGHDKKGNCFLLTITWQGKELNLLIGRESQEKVSFHF